ncbi:MAG: phage protease [Tagaea sp.]|nr:phage protease [Tagaea sp.]
MTGTLAKGTALEIASAQGGGTAAPEMVHLMPFGDWKGVDGRGPYHNDRANAAQVVAAMKAFKRPLPIDYDHALHRPSGSADLRAAGWIDAGSAELRDDGIWAKVEWTDKGGAAVAAREYRFISPWFLHDKTGRVVGIRGAGLTNIPNFEQLTALASQTENGEDTMDKLAETLAALLGLAAGATADDVIAAVKALLDKGAATASQLATAAASLGLPKDTTLEALATAIAAKSEKAEEGDLRTVVASLNKTVAALNTEIATIKSAGQATAAQTAVEAAMKVGKIAPVAKAWALDFASSDPARFAEYVKVTPALIDPSTGAPTLAAAGGEGGLSATELAVASQLGVSAEDFKKSKEALAKQQAG